MTEVLDRGLASAPEAHSPARPQAAGPPGTTREDSGSNFDDLRNRLLGDIELVDRLKEENFAGPLWEMFKSELVAYALPVMESFIRSGRIFQMVAERGRPVPKPEWFTPDDADEIVADVVFEGLTLFSAQLRNNSWNPDGGATLATYMTGSCVLSFPNVFRRFERSHSRWSAHSFVADVNEFRSVFYVRTERSAEDTVLAQYSVRSALADLSDARQRLIAMTALEMSQAEIAKELGISRKAVERQLSRARTELRENLNSKSRRWSVSSTRLENKCPAGRWKDALLEH